MTDKNKVTAISCKTSLRERWEQVVAEKDHIGLKEILLFTIGDDLKKKNNKRITERGIIIVTFPEIKKKYPKEENIITFEEAFDKYIPKFIPKKN
jgi:delta-aminolevulinic acid dehydratase/porphobilinogen synthase